MGYSELISECNLLKVAGTFTDHGDLVHTRPFGYPSKCLQRQHKPPEVFNPSRGNQKITTLEACDASGGASPLGRLDN